MGTEEIKDLEYEELAEDYLDLMRENERLKEELRIKNKILNDLGDEHRRLTAYIEDMHKIALNNQTEPPQEKSDTLTLEEEEKSKEEPSNTTDETPQEQETKQSEQTEQTESDTVQPRKRGRKSNILHGLDTELLVKQYIENKMKLSKEIVEYWQERCGANYQTLRSVLQTMGIWKRHTKEEESTNTI